MNDVVAIIPARSGSKSVAHKNIKLLSGHPLIAYSIAAAQLSKSIGRIIVSTDSEHYAGIAKKYGAEVPFIRPAKLSEDKSGDREFLEHAMEWMAENEASDQNIGFISAQQHPYANLVLLMRPLIFF